MPLEQLDGVLTTKIDVWALGCILVQFVTGEEPYTGITNEMAISYALFEGVTPLKHALSKYGEFSKRGGVLYR
jgi:serine/threonine protein kinase